MLKLGITGGIGSGKSTVSELFELLGIPVYIADIESKKITNSSRIVRQKLIAAFGEDLYTGTTLNKQLLASYIFGDKNKMDIANAIIHPEVRKNFAQWIQEHANCPIVAEEVAILFESKLEKSVDKVVTVCAPIDIRIKRVLMRDNSTYEQVLARINNQMSDEEKVKRSDFVIHNDGNESLIKQVCTIIKQMQ